MGNAEKLIENLHELLQEKKTERNLGLMNAYFFRVVLPETEGRYTEEDVFMLIFSFFISACATVLHHASKEVKEEFFERYESELEKGKQQIIAALKEIKEKVSH